MSRVRTYTDLSSSFPMRVFLIAGALMVCTIAGCGWTGALDEIPDKERIPEKPLRYVGKVALELRERVELVFDRGMPEIGDVEWMGISPEGTLMVTDRESHQAHEISYRDLKYIRSFGRTGRGPGEHLSADNMTMDPEGRVYLLDGVQGQILRYDRKGRFLDRTQSIGVSKIHAGRNDGVFFSTGKLKPYHGIAAPGPGDVGSLEPYTAFRSETELCVVSDETSRKVVL